LKAQTAWSTELGFKGGLPGWFHYEVVGFYIKVDDELVPFEVDDMPGRDFFENAGQSRRAGFELAVELYPCEGLTASLAYTFSDFVFERFETATADYAGNFIPGIPRNQVWAELSYEHPWGLFASWEVFYADGVYADNANAVKSDAYVVSNLRAGYTGRFGDWEVGPFIGVQNLFSEIYDDNIRLNAVFGRTYEPAPRRQLYGGISLAYYFGGP
jgi:iron complex outermembrane receptor protein